MIEFDKIVVKQVKFWEIKRKCIISISVLSDRWIMDVLFTDPARIDSMIDIGGIADTKERICINISNYFCGRKGANMTIYGRRITQEDMNSIGSYMDDEIREDLHNQLAPCSPELFISAYLERDPDFLVLLQSEFDYKEC